MFCAKPSFPCLVNTCSASKLDQLLIISFKALLYPLLLGYNFDAIFLLISHSLINQDFIQICDFGLAKWLPEQWTHRNVNTFEGTFGYANQKLLLLECFRFSWFNIFL